MNVFLCPSLNIISSRAKKVKVPSPRNLRLDCWNKYMGSLGRALRLWNVGALRVVFSQGEIIVAVDAAEKKYIKTVSV